MKKEEQKEEQNEERKTIEHQGKRVQTFEYRLPVSGDVISIREVGIFTSRRIEEFVGITNEESTSSDTPVFGKMYDKKEEVFKQFIPDLVVAPKDFNPKNYTDDDLMDIMVAVFSRGTRQMGKGGIKAGRSFPDKSGGGGAGAPVPPDETDGK